jgi:hypothetical protein
MKARKKVLETISPDELLAGMGVTPADNDEGLDTAIPWKSQMAGEQIRAVFQWKHYLQSIGEQPFLFGPFSFAAYCQKSLLDYLVTDPAKKYAKLAVRTRKNPDMFGEINGWIYKSYAHMLYNLCGNFMTDNRFDCEKALHMAETPEGQEFLKRTLEEFAFLENNYSSRGLTRLHAMKVLLKSLLILVTGKLLQNGNNPYLRMKSDGSPALSLKDYLEECRLRLENLYRNDAFDVREFSERATGGMIGFLSYEVVEGSSLNSMTLRHYLPLEGVPSNGKVLYLSSPLINNRRSSIWPMASPWLRAC